MTRYNFWCVESVNDLKFYLLMTFHFLCQWWSTSWCAAEMSLWNWQGASSAVNGKLSHISTTCLYLLPFNSAISRQTGSGVNAGFCDSGIYPFISAPSGYAMVMHAQVLHLYANCSYYSYCSYMMNSLWLQLNWGLCMLSHDLWGYAYQAIRYICHSCAVSFSATQTHHSLPF